MITPMLETIASTLAGLGLYFMGVGGIRTNLQQVPGRRFREFIGQATRRPGLAAMSGFLTGFVTQTSIGVSVILAGLISRGMVMVSQALPVVAWSNLGLVVLVFLGNLPLHVLGLMLAGVGGICLNFGFGGRFRGSIGPFYALGLLLLGLRMLKVSFQSLSDSTEFDTYMALVPASHLLAFLLGVLLRTPIQSTSAVVLIGITLNQGGIFSESQALMLQYGTALGTGSAAFLLTSHFKGVMRQITLFEALINAVAGIILVALFYVEKYGNVPLVEAWVSNLSDSVPGRLAYAFLIQQSLCVVVAYLFLWRGHGRLEKWAPMTAEQDLSRPRFIHDQAVQDIETGLALAERELGGLLERMPDYLAPVREETRDQPATPVTDLHNASLAVMAELQSFLAAISDRRNKPHTASVALLQVQRRLDLINGIEDGVYQIAHDLEKQPANPALRELAGKFVESLDALLRTAIEATVDGMAHHIEILRKVSSASGAFMERLRQSYLNAQHNLDHDERILVLDLTTRHERVMWLLNQLSQTLQPQTQVRS